MPLLLIGRGSSLVTGLGLFVAGLAAVLLLIFLAQRRLIYIPFDRSVPAATTLAGASAVHFTTEDGLRLHGWLVRPQSSARPRATVLFLNGNAGHRGYRAPLAEALARRGLEVLLFDYRGYGDNPGRPSEEGLLRDARAARRFLLEETGAAEATLVYFGESLGTGVAVALAAEASPAALVLRSPFTSLVDVGRHHYPFLPVRLLLRDRYPSDERIAGIEAPLLVIAGERDRIVPARFSRSLYDAAAEPKRLLLVPGADHNDWDLLAGDLLIETTLRFLEESILSPP